MSYQPGRTLTKMVPKDAIDYSTITPEHAADSCFRDLGYTPFTNGAITHEWRKFERGNQPLWLLGNYAFKKIKKLRE